MLEARIKSTIRDVPDFPKPGIIFKDITPVLEDPKLSNDIVDLFCEIVRPWGVDALVGVESRGFLYGMAMAMRLGVPFISVRKQGKLPYTTQSHSYDLEYGSATVEMHVDSITPGWNVLIHDDLLATGGTSAAAAELVQSQGGTVAGFAFLVALGFLDGHRKLLQYSERIQSLAHY